MNRFASRPLAVFLLCFLAFAGIVHALESAPAAPRRTAGLWDLVSAAWSALFGIAQEEVSSSDPFGSTTSKSDAGSSLDPFGKPAPPPSGTNTSGTGGSVPQGISTVPE